MAISDFAGSVQDNKLKLFVTHHQNKPDLGAGRIVIGRSSQPHHGGSDKMTSTPFNLSEVDVETADGSVRVSERKNDTDSQANETEDGLDSETES